MKFDREVTIECPYGADIKKCPLLEYESAHDISKIDPYDVYLLKSHGDSIKAFLVCIVRQCENDIRVSSGTVLREKN